MDFNINNLVRDNIQRMAPYSSARHEFTGEATVFVDANENAMGTPITDAEWSNTSLSRYPDPSQWLVKQKLSSIKGVPAQNIFLGNGSDEAIDLLFRIFCEPALDNIIICPPTYGMYEVCAEINNVLVKKVNLQPDYQLDVQGIADAIDENTKLIFICSPNNPTGNNINRNDIEILINNFDGLVVVDEAYINFSRQKSFIAELTEYPNLVVLQTLSKAWGLAGLRLGMAYAGTDIINYFNKVKYPYNIGEHTQQMVLKALANVDMVNEWTRTTVLEKEKLEQQLVNLSLVEKVYPSDANFILVKVTEANNIFKYLVQKGIIVRNRSSVILCDNCLRITVGTPTENEEIINALAAYA